MARGGAHDPFLVPGDAAMAFRALSRAGTGLPPVADQVDLYLGNAFTGFVTRARSADPEAWRTCTEMGEYAGRACPLSPVDVLTEHRAVAYVETSDSSCPQTYGPVQLFMNADGDLAAVSLLMGEP